jgi:hypothetical protein
MVRDHGFFRRFRRALGAIAVLGTASFLPLAAAERWWPDSVETALSQAGTNRANLEPMLLATPPAQREGMRFLLENMPEPDLGRIDAGLVATNTALAYEAMSSAPWAAQIPADVFLNDILPYACVNETRDLWRPRLRELSLPLVEGCKTPGEAARRINEKLFPLVKVKYSTKRKRPDQSLLETMESGMATCTGLSVLLADACRSVGVPARIVGTPLWANMRGNHTWVEVWDGDWHFVGAAEPDPAGLDRGWFVHDASQARRDEPRHAIYASSFRKTGVPFPMVWARNIEWVPSVNVTDRYTPKSTTPKDGKPRLLVQVLDQPAGTRVKSDVLLLESSPTGPVRSGQSREDTADMNDILPFEVIPGTRYSVLVRSGWTERQVEVTATEAREQVVVIPLSDRTRLSHPSQACYLPVAGTRPALGRLLPRP